ncbi:MAG: DUF1614 domain-containing protein [Candidatus Krumholzibacteria bacterium]|nr:DUF1614 domain-containing protein [Candidatus Krumholzibacteria bacterium]
MFRAVPFGCFSLILLAALVILFPFLLADVMASALGKLGLSTGLSLLVVISMFIGGLINIPVKKIQRVMSVETTPLGLFGAERVFPGWFHPSSQTVIAVNVGGCVIPCMIVVYELTRIAAHGSTALALTAAAVVLNSAVCFRLARPVPNVGVVLPALAPALVAAACGFVFVRDFAPPVAFTAGVLGPLLGADILNLRRIGRIDTGIASIGGAGTFDGIVLSGLVATLLS